MRADQTQELYTSFPALYKGYILAGHQDVNHGFGCNSGWHDIIYRLSANLTRLIVRLPADEQPDYMASQVKEKFGGLRFYMTKCTTEMLNAISESEEESFRTCEDCGVEGSLRQEGWWATLCEMCKDDRQRRRAERLATLRANRLNTPQKTDSGVCL